MAGGFGTMIEVTLDKATLVAQLNQVMQVFFPASLALFLEQVAHPIILARTELRFKNEGDDASGPWEQLSPVTARFRAWQHQPPYHPINQRTGQLKAWLMSDVPDITMVISGAEYIWPGDLPQNDILEEKFRTAQLGKGKPLTNPRPVVAANVNDHRAVYDALGTWVQTQLNGIAP